MFNDVCNEKCNDRGRNTTSWLSYFHEILMIYLNLFYTLDKHSFFCNKNPTTTLQHELHSIMRSKWMMVNKCFHDRLLYNFCLILFIVINHFLIKPFKSSFYFIYKEARDQIRKLTLHGYIHILFLYQQRHIMQSHFAIVNGKTSGFGTKARFLSWI